MTPAPRVRISPSPTGYFHVGGARTALFNWLFARRHAGTFILRIEDTDEARNHPDWVDAIYDALRWLGLGWDEGPHFQSANAEAHRKAGRQLFDDGKAYYCECTAEQVQARNAERGVKTPGYDEHCRDRGLGAGPGRALRFRTPEAGSIVRTDVIRGSAEIDLSTVEDFVVVRGNGAPTFILANAYDDVEQRITHVIRGEEHLPNVPKALLLRDALGVGDGVVWAHVPVIVNEQRKKLSKRRDRVSLQSYRDEGYLPEAMVNYLATLGWSPPGDDEIAPVEAMIDAFRLEDVNSSPAAFDVRKLAAFNGAYLRALPSGEFVERAVDWYRRTIVEPLAPLLQERAATIPDSLALTDFLLHDDPPLDRRSWEKDVEKDPERAKVILTSVSRAYASCDWSAAALHAETTRIGDEVGLPLGRAQRPIRVAITGRDVGPPLFESMVVLGRERTLARLERALRRLA